MLDMVGIFFASFGYLEIGLFGLFFQPEQCFSLTIIQPEQCFQPVSASRTVINLDSFFHASDNPFLP